MGWEASYDKTYYEPYSIPDTNKANISVNKIKMRQDDNYYYIDFNVDYKLEDLALNSYRIIGKKKDGTEITDYYETSESGNIVITDSETKGFRFQLNISQNAYSFTQDNWPPKIYNYSAAVKLQDGTNESKSAKYYDDNSIKTYGGPISKIVAGLPYVFYTDTIGTNTPLYKNNNATITNYKTKRLNDEYYNFNYTGTFKIPKTEKDKFNVLQLYNPRAREQSHSSNITYAQLNGNNGVYNPANNETRTWITIYGEAVDITKYYDCEHNWIIQNSANRNTHEVYCTKCEWIKNENHNFEYEYDGIENNLCVCGCVDKVNYHFIINDDLISEVNEKYNSFSNYDKHEYTSKTGYNFKYYEKYEKRFVDEINPILSKTNTELNNKFIDYVSVMTDKTDNYSTTYKAVYEPISYTFKFSSSNNIGANINDTIDSKIYSYDTSYYLPNHIDVDGYGFKGWSLTEGSDNVDFTPNQIILNYTDIDKSEFTLYPVYSNYIEYTFKYSNKTNKSSIVIADNIDDQLFIYGEAQELKDNIKVDNYGFRGWSLTEGSDTIDFMPNQTILNYTNVDKREFILYPVYGEIEYTFKFSSKPNIDIILNGSIRNQTYILNEEKELPNHINVEGYGFKGWSLTEGSDNVDFTPNQVILNYTDIDRSEFTLYPVYDLFKFNVVYSTTVGTFNNGLKVIQKNYTYFDIFDIEKPNISDTKDTVVRFNYYYDMNNKKYKTASEIKKYFIDKGIYNYYLYLNADISTYKRGTGGSGGSTGKIDSIKTDPAINDKSKDIKKDNDKDLTDEEDELLKKLLDVFEPNVANYIINNDDALKEIDIELNEEEKDILIEEIENENGNNNEIISDIDQKKLYLMNLNKKLGYELSENQDYRKTHYKYEIKEATKTDVLLGIINDNKVSFIIAFIVIVGLIILYEYKAIGFLKSKGKKNE